MIIPVLGIERWKPIPGFSGYEVSAYGRVRTYRPANGRGAFLETPRELIPRRIKNKPYLRVTLTDQSGKQVTRKVHRLVLETFVGPPPSHAHQTRHLDGDHVNNALDNLVWGTAQENSEDRIAHGTQLRGTQINTSVLSETQVAHIKAAIPVWKRGLTSKFAREFNVSRSTVDGVRNLKTWRHV